MAHSAMSTTVHQPPTFTSTSSQPLSLTESHLSVEANSSTVNSHHNLHPGHAVASTSSTPDLAPFERSQTLESGKSFSSGATLQADHDLGKEEGKPTTLDEEEGGTRQTPSPPATTRGSLPSDNDAPLTEEKVRDLEKGKVGPPSGPGGGGGEPVYAEDGSEVIVVDWKGDKDPLFPKNWKNGKRMGATLIVASFTFLSPTSSSMIAPAVGQVAERFNISNEVEQSMIVSIFVLAFAFGPLFLGPLSEIYGRTIVLQLSNLLYLVFNLACGFATSTSQMLAFRFLAGLGGSAPLSIGAGVLGDLWRPEERGRAAALYSIGPLLGPALGPLAGGWIAQCLPNNGYRWVFFSTTIACALIQGAGLLYLRETYAPVLLYRQARALKKEMGLPLDSDKVQTVFEVKGGHKTYGHVLSHGLVRPFQMFRKEFIIQILALYMSIIYGIIYITTVSTTDIFVIIYKESVGIAGTNFVAQGLGFLVWAQVQGRLTDYVYRKLKERNGGEGKPEFRLPLMLPASLFLPLGLLLYGWGAERALHWIVPDIGLFLIAAGMIGVFQCMTTYLIDAFTLYAASALAAATCLRSLCGFGFPLFAPYLYKALGYGWGCTILAGIAVLAGWPAPPLLYIYGERIRAASSYAAKKK
ncbi:MFS general substrate transporter [Meredithblackwellia eburnea MCA 4105]